MYNITLSESDIKRFWDNVNKKGLDECWEWKSNDLRGKGYGYIRVKDKNIKANRISWVIHNGPIPESKLVLHKCDNPRCVNPNHLYVGTHSDNNMDREYRNSNYLKGRMSKFSSEDIDTIKKLYIDGVYQKDIAKQFNVSQSYISFIIKGIRGHNLRSRIVS
jgi:hypothetical protein